LDLLEFLSEYMGPIWAALSTGVGGIAAWVLSRRNIDSVIERVRIETHAELSASEAEERIAFRATLMAEMMSMRQLLKDCNTDKETLRQRLNTAMAQSLVLRATVEIMEKRVTLGRDRRALSSRTYPIDIPDKDIT
jgi:L-rhamnose isomerase